MFYVIDDHGQKVEAYTKQEVLNVLAQAIEDGDLEGVVADNTWIDQLKCCVGGESHKIAFVTQAKYNELYENNQLINNALYIITDDTNVYDFMNGLLDGTIQAKSAERADETTNATNAEKTSITNSPYINAIPTHPIPTTNGIYIVRYGSTTTIMERRDTVTYSPILISQNRLGVCIWAYFEMDPLCQTCKIYTSTDHGTTWETDPNNIVQYKLIE